MYFVAKGDAFVILRDIKGKEHNLGKLEVGNHFGEIALCFNVKRSASVYSGTYSTFAKLT